MTRAAVLNRIATIAIQRLILMMNDTNMLIPPNSVKTVNDVIYYLKGKHIDIGLSGDRGDFYRRKLAEIIYLNFAIQGVDHINVLSIVNAAVHLEKVSRMILLGRMREQDIDISDRMFSVLSKISG
ncbi:hypothetical protein Ahia01_000553200, partial [Argonauta hians]